MKEKIHPEYKEVVIKCACGAEWALEGPFLFICYALIIGNN